MFKTLIFQVDDMTCGHCATTIAKASGRVDRDAKVEVDLIGHLVSIGAARADVEVLRDAIREAGYSPVPVERSAD